VSAYTLRSVIHRYDGSLALDLPTLDLATGKTVALRGANGSGKSTLLRILALLTVPTGGEVSMLGQPVRWRGSGFGPSTDVALRRQVTLVLQEPVMFSATVRSNVAFGLAAHGMPRVEVEQRVGAALSDVGLAGFEGRRARALSGGEAQRVALARALALDTPVLLLDEPTTYLDASFRPDLVGLLSRIRERGTTVVFATHDDTLVEELADEVITLSRGGITGRDVLL
jgi:tungstate transport system ATP-binding protein